MPVDASRLWQLPDGSVGSQALPGGMWAAEPAELPHEVRGTTPKSAAPSMPRAPGMPLSAPMGLPMPGAPMPSMPGMPGMPGMPQMPHSAPQSMQSMPPMPPSVVRRPPVPAAFASRVPRAIGPSVLMPTSKASSGPGMMSPMTMPGMMPGAMPGTMPSMPAMPAMPPPSLPSPEPATAPPLLAGPTPITPVAAEAAPPTLPPTSKVASVPKSHAGHTIDAYLEVQRLAQAWVRGATRKQRPRKRQRKAEKDPYMDPKEDPYLVMLAEAEADEEMEAMPPPSSATAHKRKDTGPPKAPVEVEDLESGSTESSGSSEGEESEEVDDDEVEEPPGAQGAGRVELFKLGAKCCTVMAHFVGGSEASLQRRLDIDQRVRLEHCRKHLQWAGDLTSVWHFALSDLKEKVAWNTLCNYFVSRKRVGLAELAGGVVYVVPPDSTFLSELGLPAAESLAGSLLGLQVPLSAPEEKARAEEPKEKEKEEIMEKAEKEEKGWRLDKIEVGPGGIGQLVVAEGFFIGEKDMYKMINSQGRRYRLRPSAEDRKAGKTVPGIFQLGPFKIHLEQCFRGSGGDVDLPRPEGYSGNGGMAGWAEDLPVKKLGYGR
ncbi:unnamed protein product [Effrenium voratum]|nr:unnamed protein product [Effrenium voratum]